MAYPVNTFSFSVNAANFADLMRTWTLGHVVDAGGHNLASQSKAGFMSPLDKAKLDALGGGAGDIDAGSITTVHLANGAVTTEKIAEGVTITGTLTGTASRATADGSGNNIASTYATKTSLNSYVQTTVLTDYLALKLDVTTFNSYKSTTDSALALKATKAEVESALEGKQPTGDYATKTELSDGLATKQAVGNYATKTELTQGLAGKQPTGNYATVEELESGLAGKQATGDYATKTELTNGLAGKQPTGNYATVTQLTEGLATKQAVGDYATVTALTQGLAGKQATGDYATRSELNSAIAGVQVTDGSITVSKLADTIDLGGLA